MKIRDIRAVKVQIPVTRGTNSKSRRPSWLASVRTALPLQKYPEVHQGTHKISALKEETVWVQVTAEDGTRGLGRTSFGSPVAAVVDDLFAPLLTGHDCLALEFLNDLMWRAIQRLGPEGHATIAQSGVDLALWDLKGKLLGEPVYRLLGGPCRDRVSLYASSDDLDWAMELGFSAFKLSNPTHYDMGMEGLRLVEEHVARGRDAVGPDAELMLNPVMSYNVPYAIQVAERLRPYRLHWLEEPLVTCDLRGHIELKKAIPWMTIATGEDHHGRHAFLKLIENRCVDIVQPDLCWCGGLTEALKIYALAEAAGFPTILHLGGSTPFGQHFSYAMPECPMAEFWLGSDPGIPLEEANSIPGMAVPKDGVVVPSDAPGFGLEISEDWINPWSATI